jgi:hypothetical protein
MTSAQAEDRLAPCHDFLQEYERKVEAIAHEAMPGAVQFWVTVIPSFTPEWSVGVSVDAGHYLLTHVIFDQSLWHSSWVETGPNTQTNDPSKGNAQAKGTTTSISAELYEALHSEWDASIKAARRSDMLGLDGVTYNFRFPGECGSAWSPAPETRNGKLVELVDALARLADSEQESPSAHDEGPVLETLRDLPPLAD